MSDSVPAASLFDDAAVRGLLDPDKLLFALRQALIDLALGRVTQPLRSTMAVGEGVLFLKPACTDTALAVKLITLFPGNPSRHLPTLMSTIVLMEPSTGRPLAVLNGEWITAMRTAAVSALAVATLSDPAACVVALLGSGVLARTHAAFLRKVRPVQDIRVWSPTKAHAQRCADDIGGTTCAEPADAVEGADIVCTLTNATTPILRGAWLKPGAVVAAVGAPRPQWRELDDEVMRHVLVADSREAAETESGDVILSGAKAYAELGEILAGVKPLPPSGSTVVFKSMGMAVEDAVAARLVYEAFLAQRRKDEVR